MMFQNIGETMLHSLWIGGVIYLLSSVLLRVKSLNDFKVQMLLSAQILMLISAFIVYPLVSTKDYSREIENNFRSVPLESLQPEAALERTETNQSEEITGNNEIGRNFRTLYPFSFMNLLRNILGFIWIPGFIFSSLHIWISYRKNDQIIASSSPLPEGRVSEFFSQTQETLGLKDIGIAVSDKIISPSVVGLIRYTIILPLAFVNSTDEKLIKSVLYHELSHIAGNDGPTALFSLLIRSMMFFNPFTRLIHTKLLIEQEVRSDKKSSQYLDDKKAYVQSMITWAGMMDELDNDQSSRNAGIQSAFSDDRNTFHRRISLLLDQRTGDRGVFTAAGSGVIILGFSLFLVLGCMGLERGLTALQHQKNIERINRVSKDYDPYIKGEFTFDFTVTADPTQYGLDELLANDTGRNLMAMVSYQTNEINTDYQELHSHKEGVEEYSVYSQKEAVRARFSIIDPRWAPYFSKSINAQEGGIIIDEDIHLSNDKSYTLSFVNGENSTPMKNLEVEVTIWPESGSANSASIISRLTNDEGVLHFFYDNDHPFRLDVRVNQPGFEALDFSHQGTADRDIVLEKVSLHHTVFYDEEGEPLANRQFAIGHYSPGAYDSRPDYVSSDENGSISFSFNPGENQLIFVIESDPERGYVIIDKDSVPERATIMSPELIVHFESRHQLPDHLSYDMSVKIDSNSFHFMDGGVVPLGLSDNNKSAIALFPMTYPVNELNLSYLGESLQSLELTEGDYSPLKVEIFENLLRHESSAYEHSLETKEMTVQFNTPDDFPEANGTIEVQVYNWPDWIWPSLKEVSVKDGMASFSLGRIERIQSIRPLTLQGYSFETLEYQVNDLIPDTIEIDLLPAGSIYGDLTVENGEYAHIVLYNKDSGEIIGQQNEEGNTYIFHSLPFDSSYEIKATAGFGPEIRKSFRIGTNKGTEKIDLRLPAYPDLTLILLDQLGNPLNPERFNIEAEKKDGSGLGVSGDAADNTIVLNNFKHTLYRELNLQFSINGKELSIDLMDYNLRKEEIEIIVDL